MCTKTYGGPPARLTSYSKGDAAFHPTTAWMPVCQASGDIMFNLFMQSTQTLEVEPAIQLAKVRPDAPGAVTGVGAFRDSDGYHAITLGSSGVALDDNMFWRFGVLYKGDGADFGEADVGLRASFDTRGRMLGKRTVQYQPTSDGTSAVNHVSIFPVSGWESVVGATNVKAAVIATSPTFTVKMQMYARYADDPSDPGQWIEIGSSVSTTGSSNLEANFGSAPMPPPGGTTAMFQIGIGISDGTSGTSGNEARATVHVVAAALG